MTFKKNRIWNKLKGTFKLGLVFLFVMSISNCQNETKQETPENLISEDMMVSILTDTYINNAARSINFKKIKNSKIKLDSMIYIKYDIDSIQFAESNAYYSLKFNTYSEILTQVENRLLELQKKTDSIIKKGEKTDSTKTDNNLLVESVETNSIQDSIK